MNDTKFVSIIEEGVVLAEEKIRGSVTYINFRRPGKRCNWSRKYAVLALFLTAEKLICLSGNRTAINIRFDDDRFSQMSFERERENVLVIGFESALFHDNWAGKIEFRFKTDQAGVFLDELRKAVHG